MCKHTLYEQHYQPVSAVIEGPETANSEVSVLISSLSSRPSEPCTLGDIANIFSALNSSLESKIGAHFQTLSEKMTGNQATASNQHRNRGSSNPRVNQLQKESRGDSPKRDRRKPNSYAAVAGRFQVSSPNRVPLGAASATTAVNQLQSRQMHSNVTTNKTSEAPWQTQGRNKPRYRKPAPPEFNAKLTKKGTKLAEKEFKILAFDNMSTEQKSCAPINRRWLPETTTAPGAFLLFFKSDEARSKWLKLMPAESELECKIQSSKTYRMTLKGLHKSTELIHIPEYLINENESIQDAVGNNKIQDVLKFVISRDNAHNPEGRINAIIEVSADVRDAILSLPNSRVQCDMARVLATSDSSFVQCYNCLKFGHVAKYCDPKNKPICGFCTESHTFQQCMHKDDPEHLKCHSCTEVNSKDGGSRETNHAAVSFKCPIKDKAQKANDERLRNGYRR